MTNVEFELAEQFALHTRRHCFVTGKAGTGKTTLLRRLADRTQKNVVVVAPTGVAAVNAGGVTIHSMFGLPLTCFVPNDDLVDPNVATNRHRLLRAHLHLRKEKLRVLREMDLLIVDEVSMVRCDTLDAIDLVLRTVRGNRHPFGDVQVLLIGDVHQLPPVAQEMEWNLLKTYYRSPYFFDSLVWSQLNAAQIELHTIYRQSDARFLSLLNNIRNRKLGADDYRRLRERYDPAFRPPDPGYVMLATHNRKADSVNSSELANLPGAAHSFAAQIEGEFPEHLFPCDAVLHLKVGAQVMFIRNDSEAGAYYNGKLATVKEIHGTLIMVTFRDSGQDYTAHRETWENIGYGVEAESGRVLKQELGTFSQYPLRLAWAITIHKSQGLTFDKVIVDAGRSFAAGQVYVALSRCRSLEGIVLHSLITPGSLHHDPRIGEFDTSHHAAGELQNVLAREKAQYANYLLLRLFTFAELSVHLDEWRGLIAEKKTPDEETAIALHERIRARTGHIDATAERFARQLRRLIEASASDPSSVPILKERCRKAIEYFTEQIATQLVAPLREHINALAYKKKVKRYVNHLQLIEAGCWSKIDRLYGARFLDERLYSGAVLHTRDKLAQVASSITSGRKAKGGTFKDTLDLHRQGKTAEEIAAIRGLSIGTIKSHFVRWIAGGDIDVYDVLPAETITPVLAFLQENESATVTEIRDGTGDRFDYNDIRMIVAHRSRGSTPNHGRLMC
jgi:PIF1-like helicase/Helix-turn-helix domain/UvrD-like helicase C-terminal domain